MLEVVTRQTYVIRCDGCGLRNQSRAQGFGSITHALDNITRRHWHAEGDWHLCSACFSDGFHHAPHSPRQFQYKPRVQRGRHNQWFFTCATHRVSVLANTWLEAYAGAVRHSIKKHR